MSKIGISLFLSGIFLGAGPCLVSCGPFLVSFIAGANKGPKESAKIWLIFSLTRIFAYLVLGLIVGLFSQEVIYRFYHAGISQFLIIAGGAFILFIGIIMFLNGKEPVRLCRILEERFIQRGIKSTVIFGLWIGFLPCPPLLAILSYIALISAVWYKGVFYSLSFGLGTLVSLLLILVLLASLVPKLLSERKKILWFFQRICGLIICVLGVQLIIRGIG